MVSLELEFPEDSVIDKASIEKLIAEFKELSMKITDSSFNVSTQEIKMLISVYMGYYEKSGKLKPNEDSSHFIL
tara:strand:+ start:319 stop:540 length:222 start_codon:yes stop_codon:yes gene_type:complete